MIAAGRDAIEYAKKRDIADPDLLAEIGREAADLFASSLIPQKFLILKEVLIIFKVGFQGYYKSLFTSGTTSS